MVTGSGQVGSIATPGGPPREDRFVSLTLEHSHSFDLAFPLPLVTYRDLLCLIELNWFLTYSTMPSGSYGYSPVSSSMDRLFDSKRMV